MKICLPARLPFLMIALILASSSCQKSDQVLKEKTQPGVMLYIKARIKEGKTLEAIPVGKKAIDYFTNKYPSASVRAYIESTGESDTIHLFTDYKDRATYEKTRSQYLKDDEWMALWSSLVNSFFVPGTIQFTLLTSPDAFTQEKPAADLSKGQEGKIFFSSDNLSKIFNKVYNQNNEDNAQKTR